MPPSPIGRPGSILATALGLTTVFLTLMIGSMAYVSSSTSATQNDKLRAAAEDAARTGFEMVMGWAEQSIDRLNKLPREWEDLDDGQTFDPVRVMRQTTNGDAVLLQNAQPGRILGGNTHELVVGVQRDPSSGTALGRARYVTSFKARIQQFRISENMPRQYMIGVAGRVRQVRYGLAAGNNNDVDANERGSLKVERVILATLGKEPTSRYAALTDIDLIRNWVPGEIINGPVHINRGYVDQPPFLIPGNQGNIANNQTRVVRGQAVGLRDVRSTMDLAIDDNAVPGNPGFRAVGGRRAPIFRARVTMTEILQGNTDYPNFDPAPAGATFSMVNANGRVWRNTQPGVGTYDNQIFASTENASPRNNRYGPGIAGPEPLDRPIQLPRSVRESVAAATGRPANVMQDTTTGGLRDSWLNLPDGLYVPTTRFWTTNRADAFSNLYSPTGGIYVRGNVEHLRMVADANRSAYLFQVASINRAGGALAASPNNFSRRCYLVVADRDIGRIRMWAWPTGTTQLYGGIIPAGGMTLADLIAAANTNTGSGVNPASWGVVGGTGIRATLRARGATSAAFNGVIFVDPCRDDPAFGRRAVLDGNPALGLPSNRIATTGHILNLGNPFEQTNQYRLDDHRGEVVSTELSGAGGNPLPAGKLTIMARGSIFIQNHLLVDSVYRAAANPATAPYRPRARLSTAAARTALANLRLTHSSDLMGLVADQQIVVGLRAPSTTDRTRIGTAIMASISALGDPAWRPWAANPNDSLDPIYFARPRRFVGSFTTEGLMQLQGNFENYWVLRNAQGLPAPTNAAPFNWNEDNANTPTTGRVEPQNNLFYENGTIGRGFPGHYMYNRPPQTAFTSNPNVDARGRLLVFGSVTVKKRGILGSGNTSFDKDFIFDQRLLTLAPPIFPASVNMILKTQMPFTPDDTPDRQMPYRGTGGVSVGPNDGALSFMGEDSSD